MSDKMKAHAAAEAATLKRHGTMEGSHAEGTYKRAYVAARAAQESAAKKAAAPAAPKKAATDVSFNFGANAPKAKRPKRVPRTKSEKHFAGQGGS